jgi:hypothetical protein
LKRSLYPTPKKRESLCARLLLAENFASPEGLFIPGVDGALLIFATLAEAEVVVETIVSGGGRCDLVLIGGDESVASVSNDPPKGGVGGAISGYRPAIVYFVDPFVVFASGRESLRGLPS